MTNKNNEKKFMKKTLHIEEELVEWIEDYQRDNYLTSFNAALKALALIGLISEERKGESNVERNTIS